MKRTIPWNELKNRVLLIVNEVDQLEVGFGSLIKVEDTEITLTIRKFAAMLNVHQRLLAAGIKHYHWDSKIAGNFVIVIKMAENFPQITDNHWYLILMMAGTLAKPYKVDVQNINNFATYEFVDTKWKSAAELAEEMAGILLQLRIEVERVGNVLRIHRAFQIP